MGPLTSSEQGYNFTYRRYNPSGQFIRPFVGVITPFMTGICPPCNECHPKKSPPQPCAGFCFSLKTTVSLAMKTPPWFEWCVCVLKMGKSPLPYSLLGAQARVINGLITPIDGIVKWGNWCYFIPISRVSLNLSYPFRGRAMHLAVIFEIYLGLGPNEKYHHLNLGVSKKSGTPKSSILIGFSIIKHLLTIHFWG